MLTVGIAGLGAIGMRVAQELDRGGIEGMTLAAVSAGDLARAQTRVAAFGALPQVVEATELAKTCHIVIECAPKPVFLPLARSALSVGRIFVPLSCGQLLEHMELVDLAREKGGRILVPTGAILGMDLIRAMCVGDVESVTLETRKPPNGLAGAPYLEENQISIEDLLEPKLVFKGTARAAAAGFPANVNVAAALSMAGVGPDRTQVEIWADPMIDRNMQTVRILSDSGEAEMGVRNIPSAENPRTGRITALSVIAALRALTSPLVVGS